ncbi:hypothetical protein EVAR_78057_1 [Eumeta japonica]|uniref:Eukaryotic translation elongation factor 1 epsilon-1 n=1 Tax=Eumeta variegata TaxID=151549 RepID=A0A4C1T192_EUMVA|nr:hypothetical protein EVAR_78057_1 [Eumeta japonica]
MVALLTVLTTVIDKENIEGFATIVLNLASRSGLQMSQEQKLLCYQWLEHIAMYADQAAANPVFAKSFLQELNKALERCSYLTGNFLTVADVAAYHVLYPILTAIASAVPDAARLATFSVWARDELEFYPTLGLCNVLLKKISTCLLMTLDIVSDVKVSEGKRGVTHDPQRKPDRICEGSGARRNTAFNEIARMIPYHWFKFKRDRTNLTDDLYEEHPSTVTTEDNVSAVRLMIETGKTVTTSRFEQA